MEIQLPHKWKPRPYQTNFLKAWDNGIKRLVLVWHRRAGKDKTVFPQIPKKMFERKGLYYYILPQLNQAKKVIWTGADKDGFRLIDHIPKEIIKNKNEAEMKIELVNGSIIQLVGAENISGIIGSNPVGVVFSEFSLMKPEVWSLIRPILAENEGWAVFVFTPRGMNHAYTLVQQAKEDEKWFVEILTVDETKVLSEETIEQEKRQMPRDFFLQEYYCKFIEGASSVFKGWRSCIGGELRQPEVGHRYIGGIDLARSFDRTVIVVFDTHDNQMVYFKTLENTPWNVQKGIITQVVKDYNNCYMTVDATGVGDSFVEQLIQEQLPVQAFKISSNQVKRELVERLMMYTQNKYISMPDIEILANEMDSFTYELTPSGNVTYSAPDGLHDDCVIAVALALVNLPSIPSPYRERTIYEAAFEEMQIDQRTGYLL